MGAEQCGFDHGLGEALTEVSLDPILSADTESGRAGGTSLGLTAMLSVMVVRLQEGQALQVVTLLPPAAGFRATTWRCSGSTKSWRISCTGW